jgi:hypothetical protein
MPNVLTVRAEDVKQGDFVVYAGRGHEVIRVQLGADVGLELDRGTLTLGRGAAVRVVEDRE